MPTIPEYPDLFTYRKTSVLSEDVQRFAHDLGASFQRRAVSAELVSAFRKSLRGMPAASVPRGASELREIAQMSMGYGDRDGFNRANGDTLLQEHPDLGWLLMFHGSGYVRQAAMNALSTPPTCPFEVAAVVYRLNDWVDNVRTASIRYARKSLLNASAEVISESAFFLLPQIAYLNRWDDEALSIVKDSIYRRDVVERLREQFLMPRSGKVGQSLRLILQRADFDSNLEKLAFDAKLPTVRAIAVETLLMKRARWFVGYRRDWVDKAYGITRRVAEYETRNVEVDLAATDVFRAAAQDRSSLVRRIAADYLIANRAELTPEMSEIASGLSGDKSPAVRSRVEFLHKNLVNA